MQRIIRTLLAGAAALGLATGPAEAAFIFIFNEEGPDVVAIGNGSLDVTDLSKIGEDNLPNSGVSAQDGLAGVAGMVMAFAGIVGPASFGTSGHIDASKGDGDAVAVNGLKGVLGVPLDYVSGSPLSNSMEFAGQTFASMGLTPGTYTPGPGAPAPTPTALRCRSGLLSRNPALG
jgi:hypothetical protein